ncbi:hypothetical protein D3C76_1779760 [compost metagenome]
MIRPEIKLEKISCIPKPKPTLSAVTTHCSFDHSIPIQEKLRIAPNSSNRYLVMVVMA